jgi:LacI family transcriptional regulator
MNTTRKKIKSIIDIAKIAGVSKSTVSRALTDSPKIKKETKDRIIDIVDKYKFFPNSMASSLRTSSTRSIGVIVGDINNPFYFDVIRGIEKRANGNNFSILLVSSEYDYRKELINLKILISKKVDGLLICTTYFNPDLFSLLSTVKIPFVLVDIQPNAPNLSYVYTDQIKSGIFAVNYLINKGHEKILIIYGPKRKIENPFVKGCKIGFKKAKIEIEKEFIIECPPYLKNSYTAAFNFIKNNRKKFTAIITSDHVAQSIYKAVEDCGLKIPDDISIFGNDDIPLAKFMSPPLTTISQPKFELGKVATMNLFDKINKNSTANSMIELKSKIIERESVRSI